LHLQFSQRLLQQVSNKIMKYLEPFCSTVLFSVPFISEVDEFEDCWLCRSNNAQAAVLPHAYLRRRRACG
jgi:hypothetical protein